MVDTNKLKGLIVERGMTQTFVAESLGISRKSWYDRITKGKFDSDEIYSLIKILDIDNPTPIFFVDSDT